MIASADFFRAGHYTCSMRGLLQRTDGGPAIDENGAFVFDEQGNIVNDGVGTTGIIMGS